jgi:hypothetical protein
MLGQRRRRYPSLQDFVTSLDQQRQDDRRGPPFATFIARRRPVYDEVWLFHALI